MKRTLLVGITCLLASAMIASAAEGVIAEAMKTYHKGETAPCKAVAAGTASPKDLADILKAYQDMSAAKPAKGTTASWKQKCDALIVAVKEIQAKNPKGTGDYKKAVNCKACHDVHKAPKA
ncbi:MAG: hypothetical protein JWO08_1079 [Verrucomicrobiaceae bacterium]|nr:hypothetical protein [Verrucomicrobiaceae bacterium]